MDYIQQIDGGKITDMESFHDEFAREMGFFPGYGRNADAWIDCMTDLFTNGKYQSLTKFNLSDGDRLTLKVVNAATWKKTCPDVFDAFVDWCKACNEERTQFYVEFK